MPDNRYGHKLVSIVLCKSVNFPKNATSTQLFFLDRFCTFVKVRCFRLCSWRRNDFVAKKVETLDKIVTLSPSIKADTFLSHSHAGQNINNKTWLVGLSLLHIYPLQYGINKKQPADSKASSARTMELAKGNGSYFCLGVSVPSGPNLASSAPVTTFP